MDIGSGGSWMTSGWKLGSLMRQSVDINDSMAQEDTDDDNTGKNIRFLAHKNLTTPMI